MLYQNANESADHHKLMESIENMTYAETPCQSYPDAFFHEDEDNRARGATVETNMAKKLCQGCEVKFECAAYAIKWNLDGVWGGLTHGERRTIRRQRGLDGRTNR